MGGPSLLSKGGCLAFLPSPLQAASTVAVPAPHGGLYLTATALCAGPCEGTAYGICTGRCCHLHPASRVSCDDWCGGRLADIRGRLRVTREGGNGCGASRGLSSCLSRGRGRGEKARAAKLARGSVCRKSRARVLSTTRAGRTGIEGSGGSRCWDVGTRLPRLCASRIRDG